MIKLPKLMKSNSIWLQIEDSRVDFHLIDIESWPNRGEFKCLGENRKLYIYHGEKLLLETLAAQGDLPDIFGLSFKRVVDTSVNFKSKVQSITAIFKAYDALKNIEEMHEMTGWNS